MEGGGGGGGGCDELMVSTLDSGLSSPGLSPVAPGGHYVEFLGKSLYFHSSSLHPGVKKGTGEFNARQVVTLRWTS